MAESAKVESPRLYVELKNQSFPVIFSYRELLKQNKKEQAKAIAFPSSTNEEEEYYKNLIARAALYDTNEGDDVEDNDSEDENAGADKTKRGVIEDYDYDDPFIDDSEMLVDEPAQSISLPEYDGFFVYHGPLDGNDLLGAKKQAKTNVAKKKTSQTKPKEKSSAPKKDKFAHKKQTSTQNVPKTLDAVVPGVANGEALKDKSATLKERKLLTSNGTPNDNDSKKTGLSTSPIPTNSTLTAAATPGSASSPTPKKSTSSTTANKANDTKPKVNTPSSNELYDLSPDIEALMEQLRQLAKKESFANKAKFPPALRPLTLDIGRVMFREDNTLDNNVVTHLMRILPYNRFTLNKFLSTKAGPDRIKELKEENQALMIELKTMVDSQFPEQLQQYEEKLAAANAAANPHTSSQEALDNLHASGSVEDVMAQKKYRFNDDGRKLLHKILNNDLASTLLSNDILRFQGKEAEIISENKARKQIYLELLKCFPQGWMTTIEMSRQNSQYKAKIDKHNNRPSHAQPAVKRPLPLKEQKQTGEDGPSILPQKRERDIPLDTNSTSMNLAVNSPATKRQMVVLDSPPRSDANSVSPIHHHHISSTVTEQQPSSSPWGDRNQSMMIKSLISDNK